MSSRIRLIVNAIPMVKLNTGISRYLKCLYTEMERLYSDRLEIGYFDGVKVSSSMPRGPANLNRWAKGVDLFWGLPVFPALIIRLAFHFINEALFRRSSKYFELYHEAGFFPFAGPPRLKTVFTIHDLSIIRFPQYHPRERSLYSRLFFRRRCKRVDHFLAVSGFTAREMQAVLNINPKVITITREAPDKTFYPRSPEEIKVFRKDHSLPEKYFLFVGSGDPRKNLDVIPEALHKAGLEIPLVRVGWSGWSAEKPWKNVIPLGYVNDDELARSYSGALALIFPSKYEGFGLPLLEAMACSCPVVTAREASLPEVAGEAALYLNEPQNSTTLGHALKELNSNTGLREELGRKGKIRAGEFSWEQTARDTFQAFRHVWKGNAGKKIS